MSFTDILQSKIRETRKTNLEFARESGIKKKHLDSILAGEKPDRWTIQKIAETLNILVEEVESWLPTEPKMIIHPTKKILHPAKFKKKAISPIHAKGRFCIRCWWMDDKYVYEGVEMAHYSCFRAGSLGKGTARKVSDILKTPLCRVKCHKHFDQPEERKSVELSEEFFFFISLHLSMEFEAGNIIIKNGIPDYPYPA